MPTSVLIAVAALAAGGKESAPTTEDVLSIFRQRCVECHGTAKQSGKLRLDSLDGVFKGGKTGPAVAAGKSAESVLYRKVSPGAEKRMPPKGEPLSEAEIETIRAWIDSGAKAAAVKTGSAAPAPEAPVELRPLVAGFQPVFCLAGDRSGQRFAVGRGATVEVLAVAPPAAADEKGGKKKGKDAEKPEFQTAASLPGHADVVQSLAFSADGKLLAAGGFREVRVWSTASWELKRTLAPHADRVLALALSPDGKRLLAGGGRPTESGELKLWDLETGGLVWTVSPHSDTVLALDFAADGRTVLTGGADRVSYVLEADTGKTARRIEGHTHHVLAVALSPDGKKAATAGADRAVRLWDLEGGEPRSLRGHEAAVTSVAFFRDGKGIVSTGGEGAVRFWNVGNAGADGSLADSKGYLQAGALFAGGARFAAAEEGGALRVYDLEKKRLLAAVVPEPRS